MSRLRRAAAIGARDETEGIIVSTGFELVSLLIVGVIIGVFMILPFWMIFSKAGYSGALSLTQLIPLIGLIVLLYLAFAEWPIHKKMKAAGVPVSNK